VKVRQVKAGPGTGESTSIASGLAVGETVITEGGDRLRDGASVTLPRPRRQGGATNSTGAGDAAFGGVGG
jgi:multidrug efflux system membrane fusion protein